MSNSLTPSDYFAASELSEFQSMVATHLVPGEQLVTLFREDPKRTIKRIAVMMALWTILPAAAFAGYVFWGSKGWDSSCTGLLLVMFFPAILICVIFTLITWKRVREIAYALTDRRLLTLSRSGLGGLYGCAFTGERFKSPFVAETGLERFDAVEITNSASGHGDLTFHFATPCFVWANPSYFSNNTVTFLGVSEPYKIKTSISLVNNKVRGPN